MPFLSLALRGSEPEMAAAGFEPFCAPAPLGSVFSTRVKPCVSQPASLCWTGWVRCSIPYLRHDLYD